LLLYVTPSAGHARGEHGRHLGVRVIQRLAGQAAYVLFPFSKFTRKPFLGQERSTPHWILLVNYG